MRRADAQTSASQPHSGFQGEGGFGRHQAKKTLSELAEQFDIHANQITQWKSQLLEGAAGVFGSEAKGEAATAAVDVKTLHAKIGELTLENDFLEGALTKAGVRTDGFLYLGWKAGLLSARR